jgi:hypothetical protein
MLTDTVQGIEYAVEPPEGSDPYWIGHAYVDDEVSGEKFIMVQQGGSREDLKVNVEGLLRDMASFVQDHHGVEARFVGKGWDPVQP